MDLVDKEDGVSFEHDLLVPGHLHDVFDFLHSGCCGRQLDELCTQLLVGGFGYDASKCGLLDKNYMRPDSETQHQYSTRKY